MTSPPAPPLHTPKQPLFWSCRGHNEVTVESVGGVWKEKRILGLFFQVSLLYIRSAGNWKSLEFYCEFNLSLSAEEARGDGGGWAWVSSKSMIHLQAPALGKQFYFCFLFVCFPGQRGSNTISAAADAWCKSLNPPARIVLCAKVFGRKILTQDTTNP